MTIVYFTHSIVSCWNHGNAHFVRGVLRALIARGHEVRVMEPANAWSRVNMRADRADAEAAYVRRFPDLIPSVYEPDDPFERTVDDADVVIVHEWTEPAIAERLGALRVRRPFVLLFHDTHHRVVSDPDAMRAYDLRHFDAVLAFGASLAALYRDRGFTAVHVWHEAADTTVFYPPAASTDREGIVWIGNWGDGERTEELWEFLLVPARDAGLPLDIFGVRYPDEALATVRAADARYHGWLPNAEAPDVFARHMATVHVPRRPYTRALPGVPTIRVFEALACGIPLISAPWDDTEGLFRDGDFLWARTGGDVARHLRMLWEEPEFAKTIAARGRETILERHTCDHRARELEAIVAELTP